MTLDKILKTIHRLYENNTDYPVSGSDDYDLRLGLVNDAILEWAETENVKWKQLYKTATGTISGTTISAPADFVSISSLLKISSNYYVYKKVDEAMNILRTNPSKKMFWITGSYGSYIINVNPTPTIGDTYTFYYYKSPTSLVNATDIPEMSKPMFIVYWVLARLYEADGDNNKMSFYEQKAADRLADMMLENEAPPFNNEFSIIDDDVAYKLDGIAFGQ
jgi:hypothetical protein